MIAAFVSLLFSAQVILDDRPTNLQIISDKLDGPRVDLEEAVRTLTDGKVRLVHSGAQGSLVSGETVLLNFPILPESAGGGTPSQYASVPGLKRNIEVEFVPYEETINNSKKIIGDLNEVASWLGVSFDREGPQLKGTSAKGWAELLDIPPAPTTKVNDLVDDFGITPPAQTLMIWARARKPAFVQIYGLTDGLPAPMLGIDKFTGKRSTDSGEGIYHRAWSLSTGESARVPTMFGQTKIGETAVYGVIFSEVDPGNLDLIDAIKQGAVPSGKYYVTGVRQFIGSSPLVFRPEVVKVGENETSFLKRVGLDPGFLDILRALNGIGKNEALVPGTQLVVLDHIQPQTPEPLNSLYKGNISAKRGDTVAKLAQRWGVSESDILAANPGIDSENEIPPGEILALLGPKSQTTSSIKPINEKVVGVGTLAVAATLRLATNDKTGSPIKRGADVEVLGEEGSFWRVNFDGSVGFISKNALPDFRIKSSSGSVPDGNKDKIVQNALPYLGTKYKWGGNSLKLGIDCSHFVSAVFAKAKRPCPSPPVLKQESGLMVHWKAPNLLVRRNGATIRTPNRPVPMNVLRPGDRIIIQRGLTDASGSRHTGIYAGRVNVYGHRYTNGVIHASSSKGVTVVELDTPWFYRDYKYAVRGN